MITYIIIYLITIALEIVIDDDLEYHLDFVNSFTFIFLLFCPVINTIIVTGVLIIIIFKKIRWKIKYWKIK